MAEDRDEPVAASPGSDPLALHRALSDDGGEARDYLRRQGEVAARQIRLLDLQIADLEREDAVRHRMLRIHHIGDLLKLGFEFAAAFVVLAVAAVLGAAVWRAAHDDGLVIEAFNVPADMAANGLTGQVVATQLQDHLAWMQAHSDTIRAANTYRNNWGDDIKVQIPNTGVSIGEVYRYLAAWLGHQTHITGEIYKMPTGLVLSVRTGNDAATNFTAPDIAALTVKASEEIYHRTQPYRYTVYLGDEDRYDEELAMCRDMALNGAKEDRAWAYSRWGLMLLRAGDLMGAYDKQRKAAALDPTLAHVWGNLGADESLLGHDEAAYRDNSRSLALLESGAGRKLAPDAAASLLIGTHAYDAELKGDYVRAVLDEGKLDEGVDYAGSIESAPLMRSADLALDHDVAGSRAVEGGRNEEAASLKLAARVLATFNLPALPSYDRAAARGDWMAARDDLVTLGDTPAAKSAGGRLIMAVLVTPLLADAEARLGNFARAHALIDGSARDCYLCVRVRGNVAAAEKDWPAAERWFARAAALGPSLPFAYLEWGRMRLTKGDLAGAMDKFRLANERGPHFADPLEAWGEALVDANRSDLALAKFEEAAKYAPGWERLRRKWGEALAYLGRKDEAAKQFAQARALHG